MNLNKATNVSHGVTININDLGCFMLSVRNAGFELLNRCQNHTDIPQIDTEKGQQSHLLFTYA